MNKVDRVRAYRQVKQEFGRRFCAQHLDYITYYVPPTREIPELKLRGLTLQYADYQYHKGKMRLALALGFAIRSKHAVFVEASERRRDMDAMLDFLPEGVTAVILPYIDWA